MGINNRLHKTAGLINADFRNSRNRQNNSPHPVSLLRSKLINQIPKTVNIKMISNAIHPESIPFSQCPCQPFATPMHEFVKISILSLQLIPVCLNTILINIRSFIQPVCLNLTNKILLTQLSSNSLRSLKQEGVLYHFSSCKDGNPLKALIIEWFFSKSNPPTDFPSLRNVFLSPTICDGDFLPLRTTIPRKPKFDRIVKALHFFTINVDSHLGRIQCEPPRHRAQELSFIDRALAFQFFQSDSSSTIKTTPIGGGQKTLILSNLHFIIRRRIKSTNAIVI